MSKQLKLPTLLIITDNPSVRFWVQNHLKDQFFVLHAETKNQAIQAMNTRLDVILLDSLFEDADPLEVAKELSRLSKINLIPIILITGRLKLTYRDKATQAGVTDFVSNQLDFEEIQARIAEGLKASEIREKTEDVGLAFKPPKQSGNPSILKNKFILNDEALRFFSKVKKEKKPSAVLFIQIDRFEEIENHEKILPEFISALEEFESDKDLLISLTEGKYVLLLWDISLEFAHKIADRIRKKIDITPIEGQNLTASIAMTTVQATENGFNKMIESATKTLKAQPGTGQIVLIEQENL